MTVHDLQPTLELLARTPAVLDALLRGLPDIWTERNEGPSTWTAHDIVAHLIHGERTDWIPRVRHILDHADHRPFDAFERSGHAEDARRPLTELLDEFARLRREGLEAVQELNLRPEDLDRRGLHPALGPVTLGQLLSTWAVHDLTHLHQVSRVMAVQYDEAVGPWRAYLGVLHCAGHSESA